MAVDLHHDPDPAGTFCPECLRALYVDEETPGGPRECPRGDYHEATDGRAPLPPLADQEATRAEDLALQQARVHEADLHALDETPAQCVSRVQGWSPAWYADWLQKQAPAGRRRAEPEPPEPKARGEDKERARAREGRE